MPQTCRICIHSSRQAIDAALLANRDSLRSLASRFAVSKDSLSRHYRAHLEEPRQIDQGQVSESQTATPDPDMDRYYAFIDRFYAEVATWGFDSEEVRIFLECGLESGDLPGV